VAGKGFEGGDVAGKVIGSPMMRCRQRQQRQAQVVADADAAQQRLDRDRIRIDATELMERLQARIP